MSNKLQSVAPGNVPGRKDDMRYYMIVKGQKIYFEFSYAGFREAQKWLLEHGIKRRRVLHIEKEAARV